MTPAPQAFFLRTGDNSSSQRYCIFHPAGGNDCRGAIVYLHPFAEEMNKSRRMVAIQSRALAAAGYAVLQIDLRGCGDSSDDLADATWQDWIDDAKAALQWVRARHQAPLWLWGLRAGCLLCVQASRGFPEPVNLLFWAPTPSGKSVLNQFLRLATVGELLGSNPSEDSIQPREQLAKGEVVEIAGYRLPPAIAQGFDQAHLTPETIEVAVTATAPALIWLELDGQNDSPLKPVVVKSVAAWERHGRRVFVKTVQGPKFWQTTEIEDAPQLVSATLECLIGADLAEHHSAASAS